VVDIDDPGDFEDWYRQQHPRPVTLLAASTGGDAARFPVRRP
jgi:hypothetical protein